MTLAIHPILNSISTVNGSYLDKLFDEGLKALRGATSAINNIQIDKRPVPDFSGIVLDMVNPSDIQPAPLPTAPIKPPLMDVPIGQMPQAPFLWTTIIADNTMIQTLIARLISECQASLSNPYGVMGQMFDSVYSKAVDREAKLQRTGQQNYLATTSAMGFESPNGHDQAALMRFELEKKGKLSDVNRDIMIKQLDLEREIREKALDQLLSLNARLLDLKQASESNELTLYESKKKTVIDSAKLVIDINQGVIDIYGKDVQAYAALAGVTNEQARFRIEQHRVINDMNVKVAEVSIKKLELLEAYYDGNDAIALEKAKAIGAVNGQVGANWMNGINLSQSWSTGKSWSYSESLSA